MNFKKRVNGSWVDTPNYIHNTSTDTIITLPAVIHPTGTTATVGLKGNALQSSIPSPTSPVMPQGTGERTGNLFDTENETNGKYLTSDGSEGSAAAYSYTTYIPIIGGKNYTISKTSTQSSSACHCWYDADKQFISSNTISQGTATLTAPSSAAFIRCSYRKETVPKVMLNTGSTALPYEPYGIKIPILSASTATPIYLGEVESTRKIKKLVLTGEEATYKNSSSSTNYLYYFDRRRIMPDSDSNPPIVCNQLEVRTSPPATEIGINSNNNFNVIYVNFGADIMNAQTSGNTTAGLKEYLTQQYANGTPVTVWYVLATPETAVVNEQLMKIGEYADTISNISIPVTTGGDTLSVGTTVQPSEVTVNYKGWHPVADVHECDNGAWT